MPRPLADTRERKHQPEQSDRNRAPQNTNNDSSRRHSRTTPWKPPIVARASGHRPYVTPAPFCCTGFRQQSSHLIVVGWVEIRYRNGRGHNVPRRLASFRLHNKPNQTSLATLSRFAPNSSHCQRWRQQNPSSASSGLPRRFLRRQQTPPYYSIPLQCPFFPLVDESDDQQSEKYGHRNETKRADRIK